MRSSQPPSAAEREWHGRRERERRETPRTAAVVTLRLGTRRLHLAARMCVCGEEGRHRKWAQHPCRGRNTLERADGGHDPCPECECGVVSLSAARLKCQVGTRDGAYSFTG